MSSIYEVWVPEACTLPTVEQPLRLAEFDSLFATGLVDQETRGSARVALVAGPEGSRPWLGI